MCFAVVAFDLSFFCPWLLHPAHVALLYRRVFWAAALFSEGFSSRLVNAVSRKYYFQNFISSEFLKPRIYFPEQISFLILQMFAVFTESCVL